MHRQEKASQPQNHRSRDYMRRWRADPDNCGRVQAACKRAKYFRKLKTLEEDSKQVCGFCHVRAPVRMVVRMPISLREPDRFAEIRVPYCGRC